MARNCCRSSPPERRSTRRVGCSGESLKPKTGSSPKTRSSAGRQTWSCSEDPTDGECRDRRWGDPGPHRHRGSPCDQSRWGGWVDGPAQVPSHRSGGSGRAGSSLHECRGRVGVEEDETVVVLDGLLVQPQLGLRVAAAEVGRRKVGIEADRPGRRAGSSPTACGPPPGSAASRRSRRPARRRRWRPTSASGMDTC